MTSALYSPEICQCLAKFSRCFLWVWLYIHQSSIFLLGMGCLERVTRESKTDWGSRWWGWRLLWGGFRATGWDTLWKEWCEGKGWQAGKVGQLRKVWRGKNTPQVLNMGPLGWTSMGKVGLAFPISSVLRRKKCQPWKLQGHGVMTPRWRKDPKLRSLDFGIWFQILFTWESETFKLPAQKGCAVPCNSTVLACHSHFCSLYELAQVQEAG